MWTDTTRVQHARKEQRLPSDLTDREWEVLEPFFAPPSHVGRPRNGPRGSSSMRYSICCAEACRGG